MTFARGLAFAAMAAAAMCVAAFAQDTGVKSLTLLSFEEGEQALARWSLEDYPQDRPGKSTAERVADHATAGKTALKVTFRAEGGSLMLYGIPKDWSAWDTLEIDCFNTSEKVEHLSGWVRDEVADKSGGYWDRHNYSKNVPPGKSVIRFPVGGLYRGEKGSGKFLDTQAIVSLCLGMKDVTVYFDNIRFTKGAEDVAVKGMKKFDFGPANSPNFPGFTAVQPDSSYTPERGFGWVGGNPSDARNYEQPDSLISDFIRVNSGQQFSVDVPNGEYTVLVNLDAPGFWDYMYWRDRAIEAGGVRVFSEALPPAEFLKDWYFRYENEEDLPGKDIWTTYVGKRFVPKSFKATVKDGRLDLKFLGDTWGLTIGWMALYPSNEAEAGAKWLEQLNARRKAAFVESYAEVVPKGESAPGPLPDGYALFSRAIDREVMFNSAPGPKDERDLKIDWASCAGEYQSWSFAVYPQKDCGALTLKISDLAGPGGATIPASSFEQRFIRYKFKRIGSRVFSTYTYRPDILLPFTTLDVPKNVTRRVWLTLHVPAGAKPGKYSGTVDVRLAGKTTSVPVALDVYPFTLDEPTMSIGMYGGSGPSSCGYWPAEVKQEFKQWARIEEVIADQKAHGMTAVTPPAPRFTGFKDGKAVFGNMADVDRFMEILRAHGFDRECFTYAGMFNVSEGDVEAAAQRQYGMPLEQAIKLAYEELARHVAESKWPVKMAWALADEPLIHGISAETVIKVFKAHRAAAPQMQFVIEDANPGEKEIIAAVDVISANSPRYSVAKAVKEGKSRYWFNNIGTDRYTFGWYLWKAKEEMGVEALFQWGYSTNNADVFYDFDGSEGDSGCTVTTSGGQRAMAHWERIRDGAQDHFYLQTLANLIARAEQGGTAAQKEEAAKAKAFVAGVMAKVNLEGKGSRVYSSAELEQFKRILAAHIMALR